jgi:hypothetical protein
MNHLEDLDVDGKIILEGILRNKVGECVLDFYLAQDGLF